MGVRGRAPVRFRGQALGEGLGAKTPEVDDTFCENMQFCHGCKNDIATFPSIAPSLK